MKEQILEKLKGVENDIVNAVLDVEKGFESAQVSVCHLEFENGIMEVQIIVTSNEDDFIDEPQP